MISRFLKVRALGHLGVLLVILFVVLSTWSTTSADTHYVSETGSNSFPYTSWATAADTVARAVEAASEWDTIQIAAGNYVTDTIRMKRGQVLLGAGAGATILDSLPTAPIITIVTNDSCTLEQFTLQGGNGFTAATHVQSLAEAAAKTVNIGVRIGTDQAVTINNVEFIELAGGVSALFSDQSRLGRLCVLDSCRFENCGVAVFGFLSKLQVTDCYIQWDRRGRGFDLEVSEVSIANCQFHAYDPSTQDFGGIAIRTIDCDPIIIRNNLMVSSLHVSALVLNADGKNTPIGLGVVENNTIIGFQVHLITSRTGVVFRNNICSENHSTVLFLSLEPTSTYNLTWNNTPWDSGIVRTGDTISNDIAGNMENFNAFPMFLDTLQFLLQSFSPAIDAGDPSILDADGSRSDIGYTGGPGGFSYVYQDLPPEVPVLTLGQYVDSAVMLGWRSIHATDLNRYELFRDIVPIIVADSALLMQSIMNDTSYLDTSYSQDTVYYYRLRAVDNQSLASQLSNEFAVATSGIGGTDIILPKSFRMHQNYPNPFNAATKIVVETSIPGRLKVTVYDIRGRIVASLIDSPVRAGNSSFRWRPESLGSGLYFIVADFAGRREVIKALYMK